MRAKSTITLALCGLLAAAGAASAQSYNAPAGTEAATTPGGDEGMAGRRNEAEAIRSGDAVAVAPGGAVGVPVETPSGVVVVPGERR